jgi:hypothetical protein
MMNCIACKKKLLVQLQLMFIMREIQVIKQRGEINIVQKNAYMIKLEILMMIFLIIYQMQELFR